MPDSSLHEVSNALRTNYLRFAVVVVALSAVVLAVPVAADNTSDDTDRDELFGFDVDELPYKVESPETVEITVQNTDGDPFDFEIESAGSHFHLEAEVEGDDDDVTVLLDTANVGADDPDAYLSATDAKVRNATVHANDVDDELPGGSYSIKVASGNSSASGPLVVEPRVQFDFDHDEFDHELNRSTLEDDPTRTVAGTTGFEPGDSLLVRVEASSDESYRLENETVVDDDGRFEATFDLRTLPETGFLHVAVEHDGFTKGTTAVLVTDENYGETVDVDGDHDAESSGIVIVHEGDELELEAAADQRITGEADLEAGKPVEVVLESPTFVVWAEADVDEHGRFEASVDLDNIEPGSDFLVNAQSATDDGVNGSAPGTIVEPNVSNVADGTDGGDGIGLAGGDGSDDSLLAGSSAWGIGFLAVGTVLSIIGVGVILGFGRSRSLREP